MAFNKKVLSSPVTLVYKTHDDQYLAPNHKTKTVPYGGSIEGQTGRPGTTRHWHAVARHAAAWHY